MSPLEIVILIHYYTTPEDFDPINAPAVKDAIDKFINLGLLKRANPGINVESSQTVLPNRDALEIYIKALGKVPLPTQKWTIE